MQLLHTGGQHCESQKDHNVLARCTACHFWQDVDTVNLTASEGVVKPLTWMLMPWNRFEVCCPAVACTAALCSSNCSWSFWFLLTMYFLKLPPWCSTSPSATGLANKVLPWCSGSIFEDLCVGFVMLGLH